MTVAGSALLDTMPCALLLLDEKKHIVFANRRFLELSTFERKTITGKSCFFLGSGESSSQGPRPLKWPRPGKKIIQSRTSLKCADGKEIRVWVNLVHQAKEKNGWHYAMCVFAQQTDPVALKNSLPDHFHGLVGKSPKMQDLYALIRMASTTDVNIVISGESGTGKELVASAIHHNSPRHDKPFIRVNCAALAETLLESELFGHVKGSFTGAFRDRPGTFEAAHKGTLFLDEIGEIGMSMQVKLLRVLQERVITRVGDNREIAVDVRIISASNRNLRQQVKKGKFREDLFYRLNVFPIHLPPLAKRKADIPLLCEHFLGKYRKRTGKKIQSISPDGMRLLMGYCWPGNVRELENAVEHAFVLCQEDEIQIRDFPHDLRVAAVREGICAEKTAQVEPQLDVLPVHVNRRGRRLSISREQLIAEIRRHNGNKAATARTLGISTVALWKKMKKMDIS